MAHAWALGGSKSGNQVLEASSVGLYINFGPIPIGNIIGPDGGRLDAPMSRHGSPIERYCSDEKFPSPAHTKVNQTAPCFQYQQYGNLCA
jgi:hypothetical protein